MLELRPCCERCAVDLPHESADARICSFECTFCATCAESELRGICPNCGGGLTPRPRRRPKEAAPAAAPPARDPAPQLDFWFDFISPYAFFAALRIGPLAAQHGAVVRYRPVLFAALLDHHGQLGPAEIPSKRTHTFKDVARYAAVHGIPLRGPAFHPFNPLTALRCALPEVAGADQRVVIDVLFRAGWSEGVDLGDPSVIVSVLTGAGLDGAALVDATRDPAVKASLVRETEAAVSRGVFGVPTTDVGGELFWGNDRLDYVAMRLAGRDPLPAGSAAELLARPSGSARPGAGRRPG